MLLTTDSWKLVEGSIECHGREGYGHAICGTLLQFCFARREIIRSENGSNPSVLRPGPVGEVWCPYCLPDFVPADPGTPVKEADLTDVFL